MFLLYRFHFNCFSSSNVHWYNRINSSETAAGVSTPKSVNSSVMHLAGVKSTLNCSTVTFAGRALARSVKLRLILEVGVAATENVGPGVCAFSTNGLRAGVHALLALALTLALVLALMLQVVVALEVEMTERSITSLWERGYIRENL